MMTPMGTAQRSGHSFNAQTTSVLRLALNMATTTITVCIVTGPGSGSPTISNRSSASRERTASNDAREYLLDAPSVSGGASETRSVSSASTITLSDLKRRVSEVTAELSGGDGSEAYTECVRAKYKLERRERYFIEVLNRGRSFDDRPVESELTSGQPANTVLFQWDAGGDYPDNLGRTWFEGGDAQLFKVTQVLGDPYDKNEDGELTAGVDVIRYTESLKTARPLPTDTYETVRKELWLGFMPCNYAISINWTVTVTAPPGTLHEAFFDPVDLTEGGAGATGSSGVIDPDEFTVSGDEYAIESLVWRNNSVILTLDDHVSLSGQTLDFIELDGLMDTSLNVSDATVNRSAATWTWSVTGAPWDDGDLLMLRIRDTSTGPTVVTPTIHQPTRLRIMTLLAAQPKEGRVAYGFIQGNLGLTGGNLTIHLRKLEEAGYVAMSRSSSAQNPAPGSKRCPKAAKPTPPTLRAYGGYWAMVESGQ